MFDWIPKQDWVPPFLHVVTLGAIQKGIDMVKKCCSKDGRIDEFHETLYKELGVLETSYHGGKFVGNHVKKIMAHIELLVNMMQDHTGYDVIKEYFSPLIEIQTLVSRIIIMLVLIILLTFCYILGNFNSSK